MSDFALNSIKFNVSSQVQQTQQQQPQTPQPPKSQSDHKPTNAPTSSRGPAVVLSGALAQGADKKRDSSNANANPPTSFGPKPASTQDKATGQHVNHVI